MPQQYTTEDGATVSTGDLVYDYYSMEPVIIGRDHGHDGWFDTLDPETGYRSKSGMLNGARICTMEFAARRDFPQADLVTRVLVSYDVDCDGTGFAFHKVTVPGAAQLEHAWSHAVRTGQVSFGDACELLTEETFFAKYGDRMDDHDRDYWTREGYFSFVEWRR